MYAKYTRIFRTPKETSKIHQILAVLRFIFYYKILAPSHEPVKNPVRGPHKILCTCGAKWHQNSAVLGKILFNQILAVLGESIKTRLFMAGLFISKVFYSALLFATDMRESHL